MTESENGAKHFFTVDEVTKAADLKPIWGNWLFRESLVIQVGEPGLAKTTFNYTLCKALVDHQEFLGIKPTEKDLSILYCDWESSRALIKSRMRVLGYPRNTDKFVIFNDPSFSLKNIESSIDRLLSEYNRHFDVIFIDPLRMAFAMKDENENAEASKQMKYLRYLSQKWNCALIVIHHSSKGELHGTKKASGAYARIGLVDINWNFERLGPNFDPNIFMFSIPKNRMIDDNFSVFIERTEGLFKVVNPPKGFSTGEGEYIGGTERFTARERIAELLNTHRTKTPSDIRADLDNAYSLKTIQQALSQLAALGIAEKVQYGHYIKCQYEESEELY